MIEYGILVHGGVGSSSEITDGCEKAARQAFGMLQSGARSLDTVVEAARILEDDGRFNAGAGSCLRLDGATREMDASVMDSKGNLGIVIALRGIRNPVLVARAVMATPHVAISGEGATIFARNKKFEPLGPVPEAVRERHGQILAVLREGKFPETYPRWGDTNPESLWNFGNLSYGGILPSDTIGAVAIDRQGTLAVANSTGGAPPMLLGRVGDAPMIGCGFFAGPACAIAATGLGEEIIKKMLAKTVYDHVLWGDSVTVACEKGLAMFPPEILAGLIAISPEGFTIAANREMASYSLIKEL